MTRPKVRAMVNGLIANGVPDAEIARQVGVSRQAVTAYKHKHADLVAPVVAEVERQITDYAIASKVNRIAELQHLYDLTRQEVDEFGITVVEQRTEHDDGKETVIVTRDYRSGLVKEARGILRQVSEELDELPRGNPNSNTSETFVLIRERVIERGARLEPLG